MCAQENRRSLFDGHRHHFFEGEDGAPDEESSRAVSRTSAGNRTHLRVVPDRTSN
jgi:hypothetical protein